MNDPRQLARDFLDLAVEAAGGSWYKLAQAVGVTRAAVSHWKLGRSLPDAAAALKIAALTQRDPLQILAVFEAARAPPSKRTYWQARIQ